MEQVTITRKSKVGFGYTAGTEQVTLPNGSSMLVVGQVEKPDYVGTVRQVAEMIDKDRTLASFISGGTFYRGAWFVKVAGKWRRVSEDENPYWICPRSLLGKSRDNFGYLEYEEDELTVTVE